MSELASIHNARYIGQADGEGAVIGQKKKNYQAHVRHKRNKSVRT